MRCGNKGLETERIDKTYERLGRMDKLEINVCLRVGEEGVDDEVSAADLI